ncbi:MAG: formate dehydrogenase accessory protein FdhE [Candidatus Caldarchaeum sp.]
MSFLAARLKRLSLNVELLKFVDVLLEIRRELDAKIDVKRLTKEEFEKRVAFSVSRGGRPLLDEEVLNTLDYGYYAENLVEVLKALRERVPIDGEITRLIEGLQADPLLSRRLMEQGLGIADERYVDVENEVLVHIVFTPLRRLLNIINQINSKLDSPVPVRSCLTCGRNYILGVYRGGFRYMVCSACGHVARVDFFYCPTCGNTDPNFLSFKKMLEEPYFQLEICSRCGAYYKMVNEDMVGPVSDDPLLLDLATIDLDNIANSSRRVSL